MANSREVGKPRNDSIDPEFGTDRVRGSAHRRRRTKRPHFMRPSRARKILPVHPNANKLQHAELNSGDAIHIHLGRNDTGQCSGIGICVRCHQNQTGLRPFPACLWSDCRPLRDHHRAKRMQYGWLIGQRGLGGGGGPMPIVADAGEIAVKELNSSPAIAKYFISEPFSAERDDHATRCAGLRCSRSHGPRYFADAMFPAPRSLHAPPSRLSTPVACQA